MRIKALRSLSLFSLPLMALLALAWVQSVSAKPSPEELAKILPREVGVFRLRGPVRPAESLVRAGASDPRTATDPTSFPRFAGAEAEYVSTDGGRAHVEVIRVERDSDAYSLLTRLAQSFRDSGQASEAKITREVGTASFAVPGQVAFFKGATFVHISDTQSPSTDASKLLSFARGVADELERGEGDLPVLVKHVPSWEQVQERALYLAGFRSLKGIVPNQQILETVSSEGDADAVITNQGDARFVLIEFNTPQLAGDNDRSILARMQELRGQGQPLPSAYRRVGNYSVFVFNAPSEQAANELIDQVKYEPMVQWLGDNPYRLEKMQRDYYETTAGVFVAVVKASGLSLIFCLTVGGLFGAILFTRRRTQQQTTDAFSDAGGTLRLNLDGLTPKDDPRRLLGPGN